VYGQITTAYTVQLSDMVAPVIPSANVEQEPDRAVVLLAELAKISPRTFSLLQVAFGSPSTKTPLPTILSSMTNVPVSRVRLLLENSAQASGLGSGTQSVPENAEIASTVCSLHFVAKTHLFVILSDYI
jgi:hypothetical protein